MEFNKDFTETEEMKFIWGLKSYGDLTKFKSNLSTLNDIELIYLKDEDKYVLGVETIYAFETVESEKKYFNYLLDEFTKFMEENKYDTNVSFGDYGDVFELFSNGININSHFSSIEEVYKMFKILVNGYYNSQN